MSVRPSVRRSRPSFPSFPPSLPTDRPTPPEAVGSAAAAAISRCHCYRCRYFCYRRRYACCCRPCRPRLTNPTVSCGRGACGSACACGRSCSCSGSRGCGKRCNLKSSAAVMSPCADSKPLAMLKCHARWKLLPSHAPRRWPENDATNELTGGIGQQERPGGRTHAD